MKDKLNILILGDGYGAPSYNPRLRAFCERLTEHGHHIQVCVEHTGELPFTHDYPIEEIYTYKGSKTDWVIKNILNLIADWKNRYFYKQIERLYGRQKFDAVFCTTFYTFPIRAAISFARHHNIPVHIDLRDIAEQAPYNAADYLAHNKGILKYFIPIYQYINRQRRNKWIKQADSLSTVSPWHVETLKKYNKNVHLIYNGYDANLFQTSPTPCDKFIISYTGKVLGMPMQNIEPLFKALNELKETDYHIEIHTNKKGQALLKTLAKQYGVENKCSIEGYVDIKEVPEIYKRSSIILVFSNDAKEGNVHGMMTTKFFEALGTSKPVLCVMSDKECLADTINKTNAGIAANNTEEIKAFIQDKYSEWQAKGYTEQKVKDKEQYTRQSQGDQLEQIMLQAVSHYNGTNI